jgi:NADH:ubiquinone oxidoreductase subunit 6 (subunit J)
MGWLDVAVTALLAGFGVAVAAVILIEDASVVEAALVLVLFGAMAGLWTYQSFAGETLAGWWRRRRRAARKR